MKVICTIVGVAAFVVAIGFASSASADDYADDVNDSATNINDASCTGGDCAGEPDPDALGAPDAAAASLGTGGVVALRFTDNTCLVDLASDDLAVFEDGDDEAYFVAIGQGGGVTVIGNGTGDTDFDAAGSGLAAFNEVRITDDDGAIDADTTQSASTGADIDAIECLNNLNFGTDHIDKGPADSTTIEIQTKHTSQSQQFYMFPISIDDNGEDLTGFVFKDVLPAEFDLDPDAEDDNDGTDDGICADGVCDGVEVTSGTCTATGAEHENEGKSGKPFQLQPDIVTITGVDGVCEVKVYAKTAQKADQPNKVNYTPTECNEETFIYLNEGVKVFDDLGNLLFIDDDRIELTCEDAPAI